MRAPLSTPPARRVRGPRHASPGRHRLRLGLLVLLLVTPPETWPSRVEASLPPPAVPEGPNVLLIVADDHRGGVLGIDGDPRKATPRLDRLARQGVRFDRAYCNAPVCTASRQSLITGRLPHAVGVTRLPTRLPDDAVTLGDRLGEAGYLTTAFGKMHFNGPSHHGFRQRIDHGDWARHLAAHPPGGGDHRRPWRPFQDPAPVWLNAACRSDGLQEASMESTFYADRAIEFLHRRRDDAKKFALVVSFYDPHSPFRFPREYEGRYRPDEFSAPTLSESDRREQPLIFRGMSPSEVRGIQAAYYTSLAYVDHQVGRVLDALDASGLADDTIVVYLGDNGYMLGQHGRFEKHCFYEPAVRVPLLMRWPGHFPEGRRIEGMVEFVDLFPTILEALRLPPPGDLHGRSLIPLIRGLPGARGRAFVFSEYLENEEAMVRSDRFKLVVGTGRRARQDGYATDRPRPGPYERLYDLRSDPEETRDLSRDPGLATEKAALRRELYRRLVSTRLGLDPLPARLTELEAIHWCLVPRDLPAR